MILLELFMNKIAMYVASPYGRFTETGTSSNPFTNEIPSPSSMIGMSDAVYWKPQFIKIPYQIDILSEIKLGNRTFNGHGNPSENQRQQINETYLINPAYIFYFKIKLIVRDSDWDNTINKHLEIFNRKLQNHTDFYDTPCMGVSEYPLYDCDYVDPYENFKKEYQPINLTKTLKSTFYGYDYPRCRTKNGYCEHTDVGFYEKTGHFKCNLLQCKYVGKGKEPRCKIGNYTCEHLDNKKNKCKQKECLYNKSDIGNKQLFYDAHIKNGTIKIPSLYSEDVY